MVDKMTLTAAKNMIYDMDLKYNLKPDLVNLLLRQCEKSRSFCNMLYLARFVFL